jgi:hypothetical protein
MNICRNQKSGKYFVYLDEVDLDRIKVITTLNQIKVLERRLFEDEIDVSEEHSILHGLISEEQLKLYKEYEPSHSGRNQEPVVRPKLHSLQKTDIIAAINRARQGIGQYLEIMNMLPKTDLASDKDFQRQFNRFYRIRQRSEKWYTEYYSFMESRKGKPPGFEETLDHFRATLGRYEPSFSSKLVATLDPNEPVWDQYVIQNTGQKAPYYSDSRKAEKAKVLFRRIREWYKQHMASPEGLLKIAVFDEMIPECDQITDIKKIDFVLWQTRE